MVMRKISFRKSINFIVPLTGGFGNQLFQYAFGVFLEKNFGGNTVFDKVIGNPRKCGAQVALAGISTPNHSPKLFGKNPRFFGIAYTKSFGWNLTVSLRENRKTARTHILRFVTQLFLWIRVGRLLKIVSASDLGYDNSMKLAPHRIYIGYFQTFVYASSPEVLKVLESISPNVLSEEYHLLREEIFNTKPILLHIRLTDYLNEEKFGIPSLNYFRESVNQLRKIRPFSKVWVFSDDIVRAREILLNFDTTIDIVFFEQRELSDLEVWDLMRNFAGYIISNSSFAWWGAFLRMDKTAPVCAPNPWFRGMPNPKHLLPPDWVRVDSI
jgi:hypothetical protein